MRKRQLFRLLLLALALSLTLVACQREEDQLPTAVPTAVIPQTTEPETDGDGPSATSVPELDVTTAVDPDQISWPPQVVYSSPVPGEEVTLDGAITVRFDQPMNQASVEEAFAVTPADDDAAVGGTFSWPREDTVVFTPAGELKRQQSYRLRIGDAATGQNGQSMSTAVDLELETVGFLEVGQTIPADGVRGVDTDAAITVLFNRPVVPLVTTGQQADLPQPLSLDPPVSGEGEWVSTSIYRFVPDEPLAGATTYTAEVATGLEDVTSGVLEDSYSWRFFTLSPDVVSVEPENGADMVVPTSPITVTFNMPMDQADTEAAISLAGGEEATAVSLDYDWSDDGQVVTLNPQEQLALETGYQVVVAPSAQAASGQATLEQETISGFNTVPFPAVVSTQPSRGSTADRWQRGFNVRFASPMDWSTIEGRINIEPEPDNVDYRIFDRSGTELFVDFTLELNTEYVVTIPGDVADPYGNTLGDPYTWRFQTPGGQPVASLNLPQQVSQLSTSFVSQVEIIHRNVSELNVALYEVGLPLNLINDPFSLNEYRPATEPLRSWSLPIDTPAEEADVLPLSLVDDGTLATGVYLLTVNAPETNEDDRFWQNQRNLLIVADTNIVVKEMFGTVHVWVTDLSSGQPASGRNLILYNRRGVEIGSAVSDANGFASFDYTPAEDYLDGVTVVSNRPGEVGFGVGSSNWNPNASPWDFGLMARFQDEPSVYAYIYTDRPIYRPGDTVHYKGIVRDTSYGRYNLPSVSTAELVLSAAFFSEEQGLQETFTVNVDEEGAFSGEYTLPADVSLGTYQLSLRDQEYEAHRTFSVAEYRRPGFLVTLAPGREEVLRGQRVEVVLDASYFFGGPATDLEVNWTAYEDSYRPDVPGPFYYFGDGANFFYQNVGPLGSGGGGSRGNYVTNGSGQTDSEGRLTITLPADLLQNVDEGSRTVTIEATVSGLANFPVSSRTSVIFHAAEIYAGILPSDHIATAGTDTGVDLITVDWDGQPVSNQNVEVVFYHREWERSRDSQFGLYYTRWEPIDTEVDRVQVTTDSQGRATAGFVPETGGSYVAVATATDDGGRTHTSSTNLWVTDSRFVGWRTDPRERRMDLVLDQQEYEPGDTAQILVQSPFAGPVRAWLTIERGALIEQRVVTLESNSHVLEIPITPNFAPNAYVTVTAVKGVDPDDADNPYADIRLGMAELVVSPQQLALDVSLTPQNDVFAPGETAVYDIRVADFRGDPVQAELSLALVDLAVLTLKEDNAPPILQAFYEPQPYRSRMGAGLLISGEGLEPEIPVEGGGLGGGGGNGVTEEALSQAVDEEEDGVRRDFPDTAYWEAKVTTDADGRATVEIPLPDNLTTWRLSSKAVTGDTLVGQSSADIVSTLPLLLRPVTPRFFTVDDVVQIGAIVNNNTGQSIEATVSLETEGLVLDDEAEQSVTVPANDRQLVRWQVTVDDVESADLTFRVEGGGYQDATKPTLGQGPDNRIPVYRYDAEDVVGTAGVLAEAGRRVEAILLPPAIDTRRGSVDVQLSPSLAAALIDALDYTNNVDYQTTCPYAVTDRLLPNVATAQAIEELALDRTELATRLDQLIATEISQLEDLVMPDGGWGWCASRESDPWLTAYTLFGLTLAEQAGYAVDGTVLNQATGYVEGLITDAADLTNTSDINRQAFFLYVLAERDANIGDEVDALFNEQRARLDPYAKALLALAFNLSDGPANNVQALLSDLNDSVILSATGAHWEDASQDFGNLNSDVRGTAMVIDALARLDPDNALAPPAVRWLMVARTAQHWSTGHETAWSILALTEWMAATGELDANYDYQLNVNTEPLAEGAFSQANITENESLSVPVRELVPEAVNFLDFQRGSGDGRLYYTLHLDSFIDAAQVDAVSRGITVQRSYYDADCDPETEECQPLNSVEAGQRVRVELTIIVPNDLLYATVEDPIPAGAEAIDPGLETSASGFGGSTTRVDEDYRYGYWGWWYFNRIEYRDEKVVFLAEFLPAGTYQYTYFLETNIPGQYQVMPTVARETFFPEVFGRADGMLFTISEQEE
jgi:uncharacterized protein YfaS (alpha-2-macroglobulin family)